MHLRRTSSFWILLAIATVGCTTAVSPSPDSSEALPTTGLKDMVVANLPSPYYHFEYDSSGRIVFVSFASEFTRYDVSYTGNRIAEMRNNILVNHDRLVYVYDDLGRVALVKETDDEGIVFTSLTFSYAGSRLVSVLRERLMQSAYVIDKTLLLTYYPDGNLRELAVHRPAIAGVQDEQSYSDVYEEYDTSVNVDAFDLLHSDFLDHLVLLPAVQLQRGNPHHVTRSGDGTNFVSEYAFSYDDRGRPLTRTGLVTITNGASPGQQFRTSVVYTYY